MRIKFNLYKGGKKRAFTMSYDDGQIHDLRLIEIFNKYGIKGTFNLNAQNIDRAGYVTSEDVRTKYVGHEVATHGFTHQYFERIPKEELIREILEDRRVLESLCGYPVCGCAYPYGTLSDEVKGELRALAAERGIDALYKTVYMARHIGEEFDAIISSVTSFGIFAELQNTCEGLIPLSSLDGAFVFDERNLSVHSGRTVYRLGDRIRVRVVDADIPSRRVRFAIVAQK